MAERRRRRRAEERIKEEKKFMMEAWDRELKRLREEINYMIEYFSAGELATSKYYADRAVLRAWDIGKLLSGMRDTIKKALLERQKYYVERTGITVKYLEIMTEEILRICAEFMERKKVGGRRP
ncbi:MAG: hypothetical protein QXF04_04415 [Candidatus Aenigmatarchaeota archaeon]